MHLFLIRHGESTDNVAGLYAGIRDSPLTSHGVLQARRLGLHLAARGPQIRHVLCSDLQRAAHTARAIADAQSAPPAVARLRELRERDFGSSEGERVTAGRAHADAEPRAQMEVRAARFVDGVLEPLLRAAAADESVAVVAHGVILNVLLRVLLLRLAPAELARLAAAAGPGRADYLALWSNTGYLEAVVVHRAAASRRTGLAGETADGGGEEEAADASASPADLQIRLTVTAVNNVEHLHGLKKTRGGIGSAKFDKRQKTMDSFLKPSGKKPS